MQHRQLCLTDLEWSVFGFWKFSFIQALPALEELLDDEAVWVDDLEACDVGSTRKDPVQAHVGKTLRGKSTSVWQWSKGSLAAKKKHSKIASACPSVAYSSIVCLSPLHIKGVYTSESVAFRCTALHHTEWCCPVFFFY